MAMPWGSMPCWTIFEPRRRMQSSALVTAFRVDRSQPKCSPFGGFLPYVGAQLAEGVAAAVRSRFRLLILERCVPSQHSPTPWSRTFITRALASRV